MNNIHNFRDCLSRLFYRSAGIMFSISCSFCRVTRFVWDTFKHNIFINSAASCIVICLVFIMYTAFEPNDPLISGEIVRVDPIGRIIDREHEDEFRVTRNICMRWAAWGNATRSFIGEGPDGIEYKLSPRGSIFFKSGCEERSRIVEIPESLPPGQYIYRSTISFCVRRGCFDSSVQDVPISVRGWPIVSTLNPPPLRRDPY